jgi:autotransporter strand-loop-strand O-heptosyltransferase
MKKILIRIITNSLGDTIACVPYVNKFSEDFGSEVFFKTEERYIPLFVGSYPRVNFISNLENLSFDEEIVLTTSFDKNLQLGFAEQLGYVDKFIAIGVQSTCQMKYWNHPGGFGVQGQQPYWDELCKILRKKGYTPVCVDRFNSFGNSPHFNGSPKSCVDRTGLELDEVINYILHSEFFIGLSSGLSWLAHSLGKKVVMISNFTDKGYEFDERDPDYIRVYDESVCHGCFNKIGTDYVFDKWNWYWCPRHENTPRQFECHKVITPEAVINKINHLL